MKKYILILFMCLFISSCGISRRSYNESRGLMLLENTQLGRNKAYYSKANKKTRKAAVKKFRKYNRYKRK